MKDFTLENMVNPSARNSFVLFVFSWIIILSCNYEASGQRSSIKEETISIITYPYSDPNPVPSLAINSMVSPFYPYFVFDGYTDQGIKKDWKVITLENEFINVTVLPEVGGKVWGAIEKSTGREFVYQNHVLKFRAIGIRGPWTSGGIEHNFGLDPGHAPWTASAVDYILKDNPDGSVTFVVGRLDLASRTQWRVKKNLPRDKSCFETQSRWYNPIPLHDAYLSWENAGFKATDDLQFYFPGNYYIGHDGAVNPWPIDKEGRNLSVYKENNFGTSKSYHVSGLYTNWFGGYWHNVAFGFGHWAPYSDAPGKKIYTAFIRLMPLQFYQKAISLGDSEYHDIKVIIGKNLLSYNSDNEYNRIDRPVNSAENQDYNSAEHPFRLAEDMNAMRDYNQAYDHFPANPVIGIDYGKALISTGNFRECIKVLSEVNILPQEGAHEGHDIYELANLSITVELLERKKYREALTYVNDSKNWPENLGAGKPYDPDIRLQDYITAYCYTQLRDQKLADNYTGKIINYSKKNWGNAMDPANTFIANQVFDDNGKHQEAILAMENWKTELDSLRDWKISLGSSAQKAQWVLAKYRGEEEKAEILEKEIAIIPTENRFRLFLKTLAIINLKKNE